jgi:hypothetical protein
MRPALATLQKLVLAGSEAKGLRERGKLGCTSPVGSAIMWLGAIIRTP